MISPPHGFIFERKTGEREKIGREKQARMQTILKLGKPIKRLCKRVDAEIRRNEMKEDNVLTLQEKKTRITPRELFDRF
jgi:hypothetical protein